MVKGKKFAVFDIDGTLIRWQLYHAIADELAKQGLIKPKLFGQIKSARMVWKNRADTEAFKIYERKLVDVYRQAIEGLAVAKFDKAVEEVFKEYKDQVYTYTRDLLKQLKTEGYLLFAISGSQVEIVAKIARYYGFDGFVGTEFFQDGGYFNGKNLFNAAFKDKVLKQLVAKHAAGLEGSIAVGDSVTDIPMLEIVEQPIAFNPERELFKIALSKGWRVVVERKNMIYELEQKSGQYRLATPNTR